MAKKEYIEREAVLESISGLTWYSKNKKGVLNIGAVNRKEAYYPAENVFDAVENVPAADVVEVVHGEWIPSPDGIHPIKCSNCGADAPYRRESDFTHDIGIRPYKSNYCPNCFAKMDGERKKQE